MEVEVCVGYGVLERFRMLVDAIAVHHLPWCGAVHHRLKRILIDRGWPDLELLDRVLIHRVVVSGELEQCLVVSVCTDRPAEVGECLQNELERRESLLPIDDEASFEAASPLRMMLQDDRAEEVGSGGLVSE